MNSLLSSRLYDQDTFYPAFEKDLRKARHSVLIESPFITTKRFEYMRPILRKLRSRDVQVIVNTRSPEEHEGEYCYQTASAVNAMHKLGVTVLFTGKLHRKLAIIDNEILWEGSLNILSQYNSCEIMRRIESEEVASRVLEFTKIHVKLPRAYFNYKSDICLSSYSLFSRRSL